MRIYCGIINLVGYLLRQLCKKYEVSRTIITFLLMFSIATLIFVTLLQLKLLKQHEYSVNSDFTGEMYVCL